ncbi:hypothetical protein BCR24_08795 [Enterococcus ureilyticus]|uniref:DNA topology modulation protein FlaR n=1 Tax=Enterococcus ureilyticus TaxID=1131292 RepID=A0A1E5H878_9ENTE|nr:hypothetical protein [Enterococcus ureilyticus]MBM7688701.1 adenylate kinase family enzyme [Enterococcus ureilyticus]OEG21169.1 hypothetical protein BCR24_08795 [Enterococcus ureilyticus]
MNKIMIVGPVGSGKTTFAKQLSAKIAVPYYELDNLIWNRHPSGDKPYSEEESSKKLQVILTNDRWIIEGTTTKDWIKAAIDSADTIFLLLPPYSTRVYRIVSRYIKQITKQEKAHYQPSPHLLIKMFIWNHHFEQKNIYELQKLTDSSHKKLTVLKNHNAFSSYRTND